MDRGRGEGDEELCEADRRVSSAVGTQGMSPSCGVLGDASWAFLPPASIGFPELEGHRLPSWAGGHLRARGISEKWKAKHLLSSSKDLSLELRSC